MTLTEFLTARLDEDEAVARGADGISWKHGSDLGVGVVITESLQPDIVVYDEGNPTEEQAEHIARHDPARVLADVDAKRHIAVLHECYEVDAHWGACSSCGDVPQIDYPCETLRLLALSYADHPDYDEAWRPWVPRHDDAAPSR